MGVLFATRRAVSGGPAGYRPESSNTQPRLSRKENPYGWDVTKQASIRGTLLVNAVATRVGSHPGVTAPVCAGSS